MAQKNLFPILLAICSPFFPPEGVFSFQAPKADPFISLELKPSQHLLPQLGLFFFDNEYKPTGKDFINALQPISLNPFLSSKYPQSVIHQPFVPTILRERSNENFISETIVTDPGRPCADLQRRGRSHPRPRGGDHYGQRYN